MIGRSAVMRICNCITAFLVWLSVGIIYIYAISVVWYGFILYGGLPRGRDPIAVLEPVNRLLITYLFDPVLISIVGAAVGFTAVDVRRNGLQLTPKIEDPQAHQRRLRREWAERKEVWDPPEIDRESSSIYEELREDSKLELSESELRQTGDWVVQGVIKNTTSEPIGRVFVRVKFYTLNNEVVTSKVLTTDRIDAQDTWVFEAYFIGDQPIRDYSISDPQTEVEDRS